MALCLSSSGDVGLVCKMLSSLILVCKALNIADHRDWLRVALGYTLDRFDHCTVMLVYAVCGELWFLFHGGFLDGGLRPLVVLMCFFVKFNTATLANSD